MHTLSPSANVIALQESSDPVGAITNGTRPAEHHQRPHRITDVRITDRWIYRIVVMALGSTVVLSVVGGIGLGIVGHPIPDGVIALGSAAVGALAGLLATPPHS
jgi:hypothetical protein